MTAVRRISVYFGCTATETFAAASLVAAMRMMSGTRVIDESPSSNSEKFHVLDLKTVRLQTPPTLNSAAEGVGNEDHGVSGVRKPRAKGWRIVLKNYGSAGVRIPQATA